MDERVAKFMEARLDAVTVRTQPGPPDSYTTVVWHKGRAYRVINSSLVELVTDDNSPLEIRPDPVSVALPVVSPESRTGVPWKPASPLTPLVRTPSPGRNEPCPCGRRGRKFKRCCGAAVRAE